MNFALSNLFDTLLSPLEPVGAFWSLTIFSIITGISMLLVFRYTSNQSSIKNVKNKMKAHLLELRLFKDDLRVMFSALKLILKHNFRYMFYALKPMLFMIVPVVFILIQMDGWYGSRPLKPGEAAIVSLKVSDKGSNMLNDISLEVTKGLTVETLPLRIMREREVDWRIKANEPGEHYLIFNVAGEKLRKKVVVFNDKLIRISPRTVNAKIFGDVIINPGEKPITKKSIVEMIEVEYPSRSIAVLGWNLHWLIVFCIVSIVAGFALKNLFGVEI